MIIPKLLPNKPVTDHRNIPESLLLNEDIKLTYKYHYVEGDEYYPALQLINTKGIEYLMSNLGELYAEEINAWMDYICLKYDLRIKE